MLSKRGGGGALPITMLTPTCAEAADGTKAAALSASMAVAKIGLIMIESSVLLIALADLTLRMNELYQAIFTAVLNDATFYI
jgi:hypothetical protein